MTEDEAKTKWCPAMAKESINRRDGKETCIASGCMAWRWSIEGCYPEYTGDGKFVFVPNVQKYTDYNKPIGYCGLAGKVN